MTEITLINGRSVLVQTPYQELIEMIDSAETRLLRLPGFDGSEVSVSRSQVASVHERPPAQSITLAERSRAVIALRGAALEILETRNDGDFLSAQASQQISDLADALGVAAIDSQPLAGSDE